MALNMEVTLVDSEPLVIDLIDDLDNLPTQPPSLYLDIEGVNLSRNGSISIIQIFVLPKSHIFLIDIFSLQEKAFCTSNRSGTDLRSILESALVPKVFFDVRNDSDALFAHFQISLQGIQDVQLLEIATRSYSKGWVTGLAKCIEKDAQLSAEAIAVLKATKQKGTSLFAPEHGGSYEVFNSRPMPQDIVDYCTQDVVYLPILWKIYDQKISTPWIRKVQDATLERVRVSQTASYEPRGKNKILSPWGKGYRLDKIGARDVGRKTLTNAAPRAATEVAKEAATTQPVANPQSQSSVGEADLRRSARLAAFKTARKTAEVTAELERPLPTLDLPIRSKGELEDGANNRTDSTLYPAAVPSKWTCITCDREMQEGQKEDHLAGKQHIARMKRTAAAAVQVVRQPGTAREKTPQTTAVTIRSPQTEQNVKKPKPRHTNAGRTKDRGTNRRESQAAGPGSQQRGLPYPPDYIFSGFGGSFVPRNLQYETAFSLNDMNYGLCDKDCGWCGHCMNGVDI